VRLSASCAAALATLVLAAPAGARENTQWLSWGRDNQLTNAVGSKALTPTSVRRLKRAWLSKLDGAVFASPLAAPVGGRETIFAATEAGSVYALDADTGRIVWQRSLGVVETPSCGPWGITSTGAIDGARNRLYEISADGELHALDLATGSDAAGFPRRLVTNTEYEYVWGGLRIANDRLYVPIASYCDAGPEGATYPDGRLLALPLANPDALTEWEPVPGPGNLGGIWGWGGVAVDPADGTVYTGVGNSHVFSAACGCYVDNAGYGNQIVALTPNLSRVLDAQAPNLPVTDDDDFGAAPLLFQPKGCAPLAAANNKIGSLYIWNRKKLAAGTIVPPIPLSDGVAAFVGSPSWSASRQLLFDAQAVLYRGGTRLGNGVRAFRAGPGCTFKPAWAVPVGDGNQATPLVVGDVVFATGGSPGGFAAMSARSGAVLWKAATIGPTVAALISVEGAVFGADADGWVYGYRAVPPVKPAAPPPPWRLVR